MVANQLYELCEAVGPDCTRYVACDISGFYLPSLLDRGFLSCKIIL